MKTTKRTKSPQPIHPQPHFRVKTVDYQYFVRKKPFPLLLARLLHLPHYTLAFPQPFKKAYNFSDNGLAPVQLDNDRWTFITPTGEQAFPQTFKKVDFQFVNGHASVWLNHEDTDDCTCCPKVINTKGEIVS